MQKAFPCHDLIINEEEFGCCVTTKLNNDVKVKYVFKLLKPLIVSLSVSGGLSKQGGYYQAGHAPSFRRQSAAPGQPLRRLRFAGSPRPRLLPRTALKIARQQPGWPRHPHKVQSLWSNPNQRRPPAVSSVRLRSSQSQLPGQFWPAVPLQ